MTDVLVKKKTQTNQSALKIKENQKVNHGGNFKAKITITYER